MPFRGTVSQNVAHALLRTLDPLTLVYRGLDIFQPTAWLVTIVTSENQQLLVAKVITRTVGRFASHCFRQKLHYARNTPPCSLAHA